MKIKVLAILTVVAVLHLVVLGVVSLSGGCRHPEVLQPRGNVPPPAVEPGDVPAFVPEKESMVVPPPATTPKATETSQFKSEPLKHTVKANDSLWKVARMYGVSIGELAAENKMGPEKVLKVGTVLIIPPGGSLIAPEKLQSTTKEDKAPAKAPAKGSAKTPKNETPKKSAKGEALPSDGTYVVKANDSLWKIAVKYGLKRKDIADANKISETKPLQVGQKLVLPTSGSSAKKASSTTTTTSTDVTATTTESVATEGKTDIDTLLKTTETKKETVTGTPTPPATGAKDVKVEETVTETEEVTTEPAAATPAPAGEFISHETTEGETLDSISALYGFTVSEILALNPTMTKDGKIPPFTKVKIPRSK